MTKPDPRTYAKPTDANPRAIEAAEALAELFEASGAPYDRATIDDRAEDIVNLLIYANCREIGTIGERELQEPFFYCLQRYCKARIPTWANFCPNCGTAVADEEGQA